MIRVLAIDPGERVGWAKGIVHPDKPESDRLEITGQGVHHLKDFAIKLGKSIADYDVVVYEVWRLYPGYQKKMVGNDMQPSQLIGMIRYLAWTNPDVKLVSQGARIKNTAMKTMPEEIKDRMKLSTEQHDQDALMHLWYYTWDKYIG